MLSHQSRKDFSQEHHLKHKNLFGTGTKQTRSLLKINNKPVSTEVGSIIFDQISGCNVSIKSEAKKISSGSDKFKHLCRTCGEEHQDLTEFFSSNGITMKLKEKISIVLSIEITDSDNRPLQICAPCISSLEQAYELKMKSDSTEKMFQDMIERNNQMGTSQSIFLPFPEIEPNSPDCWDDTTDIQIDENSEDVKEEKAQPITPIVFLDYVTETCKMASHQLHCPRCFQQFQNIHDFLIHQKSRNHNLQIKAFCVKCAIFFNSRISMLDHLFEVHPDSKEEDALVSVSLQASNYAPYGLVGRTNKCTLCSKSFMTSNMLLLHKRNSHKIGVKYKTCDKCGESCPGIAAYKRHMKTHISKEDAQLKFRCQCCGSKFATNKEIIEHMRQEHKGTAPEFKCDICSKVFNLKVTLKNHTKFVHGEHKLCDICGKHLKSQCALEKHKLLHAAGNGSKVIPCEICFRFIPVPLLVQHILRHFSKYPYSCLKCGKNFVKPCKLEEHMKIHLNPGVSKKCSICTLKLGSSAQLIHHKNKHININGSYFCPICNENFMGHHAASIHAKENHREEEFIAYCAALEQIYECTDCNGIFKSPKELERHKSELGCTFSRDVEKNKILSCKYCLHVSQDISGYVSHLQTHPEAFSAKCRYCDEKFKNSRSFQSHEERHMIVPTRTFKCDICGAFLISKTSLKTHLLIHDSNTYTCVYCHKIFATKKNLEQHKRTHLPNDTFQCDICKKGFKMRHLLLSHMREKHHEPAKYSCDQCSYVCNRMYQLLAHKRKGCCNPYVVYTCDICDKVCKSSVGLKQHKSMHNSR